MSEEIDFKNYLNQPENEGAREMLKKLTAANKNLGDLLHFQKASQAWVLNALLAKAREKAKPMYYDVIDGSTEWQAIEIEDLEQIIAELVNE